MFIKYHVGIEVRIFLLSTPFGSIYHIRTFMPRQNFFSIDMNLDGMDPNNDSDIPRFSQLMIPHPMSNDLTK